MHGGRGALLKHYRIQSWGSTRPRGRREWAMRGLHMDPLVTPGWFDEQTGIDSTRRGEVVFHPEIAECLLASWMVCAAQARQIEVNLRRSDPEKHFSQRYYRSRCSAALRRSQPR